MKNTGIKRLNRCSPRGKTYQVDVPADLNRRKLLRLITEAINLAEITDTLIDKQYFEEMGEELSILDMLTAVSISLEGEIKNEKRTQSPNLKQAKKAHLLPYQNEN